MVKRSTKRTSRKRYSSTRKRTLNSYRKKSFRRRKSFRKGYVKYDGGFSFFRKTSPSVTFSEPQSPKNIKWQLPPSKTTDSSGPSRTVKWHLPHEKIPTQYENTDIITRSPVHITSKSRPIIHVTDYDEWNKSATEHLVPKSQDPEKLGTFWYSTNPQFMTKRDYFMKHRGELRRYGFLYPHIFDTHPKFSKMSLSDLQRYMKLSYGIY